MDEWNEVALRSAYEAVTGPLGDEPEARALLACVSKAVTEARAAHPALAIVPEAFVGCIAGIAGNGPDAAKTVTDLLAPDLLLAHAALSGERDAQRLVHEILNSAVLPIVRQHLGSDSARVEEVMQRVLVRMLVGDQGGKPKLGSYRATGRFTAWARVVARRIAFDLLAQSKGPRMQDVEDSLVEAAIAGTEDPELHALVAQYTPVLRVAMDNAVAALSDRERALLRMSLIDNASIDELARIFSCHRATAARWVVAAKETLEAHARREFCALARTSETEYASLVHTLRSYFDVSVERLLAEPREHESE